jgi:class 3 adenylate cyclase
MVDTGSETQVTRQAVRCAILFADISGSTRLYEQRGDRDAQAIIARALTRFSEITKRHQGRVVKTIGDEIMSVFPSADDAVQAACAMQEYVLRSLILDAKVSIRAGLHYGPALVENDGDVFGDAVNVAARMVQSAKAEQILTTEETVERLSPARRADTRPYDWVTVKGRSEKVVMHEVIWQQHDMTGQIMVMPVAPSAPAKQQKLTLRWRDTVVVLDGDAQPLVMGRGEQAGLMVLVASASRSHARIEARRGKFVLVDQSTNGTFLRPANSDEIYLRREEHALLGEGEIGLGQRLSGEGSAVDAEPVRYSLADE